MLGKKEMQLLTDLQKKLLSEERRLASDENAWLKVVENSNRQHSDSLNQLADLFKLVGRQQEQLIKTRRRLAILEHEFHRGLSKRSKK